VVAPLQAMSSLHPEMDRDTLGRVTQWILADNGQGTPGGVVRHPSDDLLSLLSPEVHPMLRHKHSGEKVMGRASTAVAS
jgi:hypothetical protein